VADAREDEPPGPRSPRGGDHVDAHLRLVGIEGGVDVEDAVDAVDGAVEAFRLAKIGQYRFVSASPHRDAGFLLGADQRPHPDAVAAKHRDHETCFRAGRPHRQNRLPHRRSPYPIMSCLVIHVSCYTIQAQITEEEWEWTGRLRSRSTL
jgi:hypothetical protein